MMRHLGINLTVTCKKADILAKLHANREEHQKMVAEARKGYLKKAHEALFARLQRIENGEVVDMKFGLTVPLDYSRVYASTIAQLEAHQEETITLTTNEFNMLVEDEWEWVKAFIEANKNYSGSTRAWSITKGFEVD